MSVTLTTSAQTTTGTTLTFASTSGVTSGMMVSGTNIAAGTTVSSVTSTTVVLSQAVTGTVASGASIIFNAVTTVQLTTSADTPSGSTLPFWDTTGVTTGMYVYGTSVANGATVTTVAPTTVTLSAALTGDVPVNTSITFSSNSSFTPTPTPATTVTPLNTSAATQTGAVLPFSSTTGVSVGMYVYAKQIASGTTVQSLTSTAVTLSRPIIAPVPNNAPILFSTILTGFGTGQVPSPTPAPSPTPTPTTTTSLRNITNFLKTIKSTTGNTYYFPQNFKGIISGTPATTLPSGVVHTQIPFRTTAPTMGTVSPRVKSNATPSGGMVAQARLAPEEQRAPEQAPADNAQHAEEATRFNHDFGHDQIEPPPEPQNTP